MERSGIPVGLILVLGENYLLPISGTERLGIAVCRGMVSTAPVFGLHHNA
jgi:hypothetical protein